MQLAIYKLRLRSADVDALARQLPEIRRQLLDFRASLVGGENYLRRIHASARDESNPVEDCAPGERFLFVDEQGLISPSSFTSRDYSIDAQSISTPADFAELAGRFRTMQRFERSAQCQDCLSTQVCDKFSPHVLPALHQPSF